MVVPDIQGIRAALLNVFRTGKDLSINPETLLSSGMIAEVENQDLTGAANAATTITIAIPAGTSDLFLGFVVTRGHDVVGADGGLDATAQVAIDGATITLEVSSVGVGPFFGNTLNQFVDLFLSNPSAASATAFTFTLAAGGAAVQTRLRVTVIKARFPGIQLGPKVTA